MLSWHVMQGSSRDSVMERADFDQRVQDYIRCRSTRRQAVHSRVEEAQQRQIRQHACRLTPFMTARLLL